MDLSNNSDPVDSRKYPEIIGSLMYLMTCIRPDLSYAVGKLSQYLSEPRQQHWVAAKYILKYLKGTFHYELHYQKGEELGILVTVMQIGHLIRVIDVVQQDFVFI